MWRASFPWRDAAVVHFGPTTFRTPGLAAALEVPMRSKRERPDCLDAPVGLSLLEQLLSKTWGRPEQVHNGAPKQ